jgi:hypothetical protein
MTHLATDGERNAGDVNDYNRDLLGSANRRRAGNAGVSGHGDTRRPLTWAGIKHNSTGALELRRMPHGGDGEGAGGKGKGAGGGHGSILRRRPRLPF